MTPNPWALLSERPPFVAAVDAEAVEEIDRWARQEPARLHAYGLQTQLFPEPFIGRVDAPVVLWTANPGYADEERVRKNAPLMSATDDWWHANSVALREASAANLAHRDQPYPLFFLDPRLEGAPGHWYYTYKQMKWFIQVCGVKVVARNVLVVEEFPYHSRSYRAGWKLPSQAYSLELIRAAVKRGAILILLRSAKLLEREIPEIRSTTCLVPRVPRSPALSPNNLPGFEDVTRRIELGG